MRSQPLQPYMDKEAIVKHTRPWQQVLMFFARTPEEHAWKSPGYQFTRRQQEVWEELICKAEAAAAGGAEEKTDEMNEMDEMDEIDENDEEDMETEQEMEKDKEQSTTEAGCAEGNQAIGLSRIQKACLSFCIALIDQRITRREYDSPLVCALAVLGVKAEGRKGAEQYPPILSAMIKVAQFMVVQQGLELADPIDESSDKLEEDSAYESHPSRQPPKGVCSLCSR
jgi:hypothetical protein